MRFNKYIIAFGLLLTGVTSMAQQDPNFALYRYNMQLINPAYAGAIDGPEGTIADTGSEVGINIKSQFAGIDGAPETQSLFFGTGVDKNLGLGVSIINDRTFIENQTFIGVDFSYRLQFSPKTNLFLGLKAGANSYNVNTNGLTTFDIGVDPSLVNLEGTFSPNFGLGAYLKGASYFLAFSIPKIINNSRLEQDGNTASLGRSRSHVYLAGGYDFKISKTIVFKPSTLFRYVDAAPLSVDLTGSFSFNNLVDLGLSYRFDEGINTLVAFKFKVLDIGYSYGFTKQNIIAEGSNGSHEVFMKLRI